LKLSHHSLVQYRLSTTGELVPLLQIAPSETDNERLSTLSDRQTSPVMAGSSSVVRADPAPVPVGA
jgi:hypothetical protein